jgi:hypothetical protein
MRRSSENVSNRRSPIESHVEAFERFGRDHQRVERDERSTHPGQVARVRLGGTDQHVGAHGPAVGRHRRASRRRARHDVEGSSVFDDGRTQPLDGVGQAMHQLGRLHPSPRRVVERAEHVGGGQPLGGLPGGERHQHVVGEPVTAVHVDLGALTIELRSRAGEADHPTRFEPALDPLVDDHAADLGDGVHDRPRHRDAGIAAPGGDGPSETTGEFAHTPATVTAGRTEADHLTLDHQHS